VRSRALRGPSGGVTVDGGDPLVGAPPRAPRRRYGRAPLEEGSDRRTSSGFPWPRERAAPAERALQDRRWPRGPGRLRTCLVASLPPGAARAGLGLWAP